MSESTTIARPYAKAIFEHALSQQKLPEWSVALNNLAQASLQPEVISLLSNPLISSDSKADIMMTVIDKSKMKDEYQFISNFVSLLIENKRLPIVSDIQAIYESLKAEHDKTLAVDVRSFEDLTKEQITSLSAALEKRFKRKIQVKTSIDQSLLGGAVISADGIVIDGSVRSKLSKMNINLIA